MPWFIPLIVAAILVLAMPLMYMFSWLSDQRRIRAYLERRGATQITIQLHATIPGRFGSRKQPKRVYRVSYVSATGVAHQTSCISGNDWWEGKEITWHDAGSDLYELVPTARMRTTGLNSTQLTGPHGYPNPLTMRKSQQK